MSGRAQLDAWPPLLGGGLTPVEWLRSIAKESRKVRANMRADEADAITDWLERSAYGLAR